MVAMATLEDFSASTLTEDDKLDWQIKAESGELIIQIKIIKNK
jgi:hypothetical protein